MRRRHFVLILIFVIAVGVRLAYMPAHQTLYEADLGSGELARGIARGHWLEFNDRAVELVRSLSDREHRFINPAEVNFAGVEAKPQWQPFSAGAVGTGIVLAGVWEITGSERYVYGQILQIAVDSVMVFFIYRIVLLLFKRRRAALIAAALYAVFPPIAQHTSLISVDIWAVDFTIAIVAVYLEAMRSSHRLRLLVLCGVIVGMGAYFRPNLLLLPGVLSLVSLVRSDWRRYLREAITMTAVALVLVMPWTVINYVHFHRFILTRTGLGVTLWVGLSEVHNSYGINGNEAVIRAEVHRERPKLVYASPAYDAYVEKKALHVIEQHPSYYAKLVARRVLLSTLGEYESAWMHANGESPFLYKTRTGRGLLSYLINRPLNVLQDAFESVVFMLAMLALALTWRGRQRAHIVLIAVVLATLLPYWIIHYESRYVLPASLGYIVWISLGADLLADRVFAQLRMPSLRRVSTAE